MKANRRTLAPSPNSIAARLSEEQGLRLAATSRPRETFRAPRRTHVDDMAVDRLAAAMKERFIKLREPGCDWDDPRKFSPELLAKMLGEAACTGDVVLVGVIAAMILTRDAERQVIAEHAMRAFLHGSCHDQSQRIAELELKLDAARQAMAGMATEGALP